MSFVVDVERAFSAQINRDVCVFLFRQLCLVLRLRSVFIVMNDCVPTSGRVETNNVEYEW